MFASLFYNVFTILLQYLLQYVSQGACFTMVFTMFLAEHFCNIFTLISFYKYLLQYVLQGECFTMVFTMFLSEHFYNIFTLLSFYKYLFHFNSSLLHYVSRFLFILFTMFPTRNPLKRRDIYICTYTGEDWGSGFTFIYALRSLILFLNLTAGNWDYLY